MNLQLGQVLSDLTGEAGLAILHAIVGGEHDPLVLTRMRHGNCKHLQEDLIKALTGHYRKEHLFVLKQALEMFETFSQRLQECDQEIERLLEEIQPELLDDFPPLPPDPKPNSHSQPPSISVPGWDWLPTMLFPEDASWIAIPSKTITGLDNVFAWQRERSVAGKPCIANSIAVSEPALEPKKLTWQQLIKSLEPFTTCYNEANLFLLLIRIHIFRFNVRKTFVVYRLGQPNMVSVFSQCRRHNYEERSEDLG